MSKAQKLTCQQTQNWTLKYRLLTSHPHVVFSIFNLPPCTGNKLNILQSLRVIFSYFHIIIRTKTLSTYHAYFGGNFEAGIAVKILNFWDEDMLHVEVVHCFFSMKNVHGRHGYCACASLGVVGSRHWADLHNTNTWELFVLIWSQKGLQTCLVRQINLGGVATGLSLDHNSIFKY